MGRKTSSAVKIKREKINVTNMAYAGMVDGETGYIKLG